MGALDLVVVEYVLWSWLGSRKWIESLIVLASFHASTKRIASLRPEWSRDRFLQYDATGLNEVRERIHRLSEPRDPQVP